MRSFARVKFAVVCAAVLMLPVLAGLDLGVPDETANEGSGRAEHKTPLKPSAEIAATKASQANCDAAARTASPQCDKEQRRRKELHKRNAHTEPLTGAAIGELRKAIRATPAIDQRLALRRDLIYRCHREGLAFEAHAELEALLRDVLAELGPEHAHQVAFVEAMALKGRHWHEAALRAFDLMESRYREGPQMQEAWYQAGLCHLELKDHAVAARMFAMVADTAESQALQDRALRKLAFAQLLNCDHDASLATLRRLETSTEDPTIAEYAQMRAGFVLATANRIDEAITAHKAFLEAYPGSRYGRIVLRQLGDLKKIRVAAAH